MQTSFIERRLSAWLMRQTSTSGVRKVAQVGGAIGSELGNVRNDNQDKAVIFQTQDASGASFSVAVVADGIGGMQDGAKCAALGVAAFVSEFVRSAIQENSTPETWLSSAMRAANETVFLRYRGLGGTTFVAIITSLQAGTFWTSAGDSRLYGFGNNKLTQISVDDTIAGQLGKQGPVPNEHAKILQYVGMGKDFWPHVERCNLPPEQLFLLTTDGVHYVAENSDVISRILQHSADAGVLARRLVDLAKWCGGPDNATVAILPSGRTAPLEKIEDLDALVVWDAFGELQLDLGRPPLRFGRESSYESQPKDLGLDRNENEGDPKLFETQLMPAEDAANLGKVNPTAKKSKPRGRQPKDKAPEKVVEKAVVPQLDIKFSSKPE